MLLFVCSISATSFAVDYDWGGAATPDTAFTTAGNWDGVTGAPAVAVGGSLSFDATGAANRTVTGVDSAYKGAGDAIA